MIARRTFIGMVLSSLYASGIKSARLNAEWIEKKYYDGISESLISGKANEDLTESMSNLFEIPQKPKCQFEFGPLMKMAKRLQDEHVDLFVLNGIEYAWIKASFPEFIPLVTSYTTDVKMKACVLVTVENSARSLIDLKGKAISLPERLPHHTYIYLQRAIEKQGGIAKGFFERSLIPTDSNDGIESVIDGKANAILLDFDSWKGYQELKPGRAHKLRVLDQSTAFPTSLILYQKKSWNKAELLLLELALCSAHEKAFSRQLFNCWGISKFVPCGARYQQAVDDVLREFPQQVVTTELVLKK